MAGFFDTLFGGGAEKEAAAKNRSLYDAYQTNGTTNLTNGLNTSLASLGQGYGNANATLGQNTGVWNNYGQTANSALDSGMSGASGALGQARGDFAPLTALGQKYGGGTSLYLDSLGVNGAGGNQRAVDSFQAGPGYNFTRDQGLDAINRRRAAGGMLNSGNADIDALKFGTGLANQTYGDWQSRLGGLVSPELSATSGAASGMAGADTSLANLYSTNAGARAGIAGNVATGQAGVNTGQAGNLAALGQGQAGLQTQNASDLTNLAGSVTSGNAQANNAEAAGQAAGAKNLMNGALSLGALGVGAMGGGFGGLGSLGGMFGGGTPTGASVGAYGAGGNSGSGMFGGIRYPAF